ncbi:MAG: ankyrin repeat domain-containing protein [Acidobacteriota bacterium]|nr:ankyrin repeat domain-containing protein [Acidobacteriota bacterium]
MSSASPLKDQTPSDAQALMRAAGDGDAARVRSLLASGAEVNAAAEGGETALMRASAKGHLDVVEVLLDAGGDVHAKSENGFTPLFMAVFFGHVEVARMLLARGSDPSEPTHVNTTAEKWARSWGSAEIVRLLDEAGAKSARGSAAEGETSDAFEKTHTQPIFFPPDGEAHPVVPLAEVGDAHLVGETTPLAKVVEVEPESGEEVESESGEDARHKVSQPVSVKQRDAPDETTHVAARPTRAATAHSRPAARAKGARQSWAVPLVALALSLIAGLVAGTYLMKSVRPAATRQPATEAHGTATPLSPEPETTPVAPAVADIGAEAKVEARKEAGPVPKSVTREAARSPAPDAEPPSRRTAVSDERPDRVARRSVERSTASRPAQSNAAATSTRTRGAERASSGPPKHSLPISPPPPSAESKKVIQWP